MRQLRIRILMIGLSAVLFFLTVAGTNEVARAQAASNTPATTPPGLLIPKIQPIPTPTNDDEADTETVSKSPTREITEVPQPQTNATPPSPALPQTQTNATPPSTALPQPQTNTVPVKNLAPPPPAPAPAPPPEEMIEVLQFQGAPVSAVLEWYARLTGKSIIAAPTLAGTINFRSQSKLTKSDALQALDSVLAINGIAAIPLEDKFLKVVQITTAKQEGLPVGKVTAPADTLGTQIIPLKYADAA